MGHTTLETGNHNIDFLSQSFNTLTQIEALKIHDLEKATNTYSEIEPNLAKLNGGVPPQYHIVEELGYSFFQNQPRNLKKEYLDEITTEDMAKLLFLHTRGILLHRVLENTNIFNYKLEDIVNKVYLYEYYNLNVKNLLLYRPELLQCEEQKIEEEIFENRNKDPFCSECRELIDNLTKQYFENKKHPLLTAKQEYLLFQGLEDIRKSLIDKEKLLQYKNEIREVLVKYNMRLIYSIAKRYFPFPRNEIEDKEKQKDIFALGIEGIFPAIRKFNHKIGVRFSTVASEWIRQNISQHLSEICSTIYIPYNARKKDSLLRKEELRLKLQRNHDIPFEEIWVSLRNKGLVKKCERDTYEGIFIANKMVYLNSNIKKTEESVELIELIPSPEEENIETKIETKIQEEIIQDQLRNLLPKEQEILNLTILSQNPKTFAESASVLGITTEGARKRYKSAIKALRKSSVIKELLHPTKS